MKEDRVPAQWATAQNNLGNILWVLGQRRGHEDMLERAVTAYEAALEVFTPRTRARRLGQEPEQPWQLPPGSSPL